MDSRIHIQKIKVMISGPQIFWRYVAFCILAMLANLGAQAVAHEWLSAPDWLSIGTGTGAGLVLKYMLDRNYIFYANKLNVSDDLKRFGVYTLFGLFTTLIFWSIEWFFIQTFSHPSARYIGGALGLSIGYLAKYIMDRRWVFTDNNFSPKGTEK